jgi:3-oxoacyl-[acyl-carrier-protein] synthase-3
MLQGSLTGYDVEKISKSVGVKVRHIADSQTTAGDMAVEAAKKMFAEYGISPKEIDFVIFATQTPDHFLPSTACIIQSKLGVPTGAGAFDFDLGCSGYVYGLGIANSFVESGFASNVLLLTADTITKLMHPNDPNRILFGEAASATVISNKGFAKIGCVSRGSDGDGAQHLIVKNRAARSYELTGKEEMDSEGNVRRDDFFYMDGFSVFSFTVDRVPSLVSDVLKLNGLQQSEIDYFVFHQANKHMLNTIRKLLGVEKDKYYVNIEDTGNTTSSTVPLALKDCLEKNMFKQGGRVMIAGFGVGLSWAGTVLFFE